MLDKGVLRGWTNFEIKYKYTLLKVHVNTRLNKDGIVITGLYYMVKEYK